MYYRRKIILSLLQMFKGRVDKISFQKLIFLLSCHQVEKSYYFVPYKFGCFSFQANADLNTLAKYNLVTETNSSWGKNNSVNYFIELKVKDQAAIRYLLKQFETYSQDELVKFTYRNYPYYAINSTIASKILTASELEKVERQKPNKHETVLFTIGYEGISLEQYLNKLIINDVRVLCDVRRNSLSMKYGFSKSQLENACKGVGIEFIHMPEVGIDSDRRQELNNQADYDKLFSYYRKNILKNEIQKQREILSLLEEKGRVALTCFEANIHHCHRKHLAESISQMNGFNYELQHI